MKLGLDLYIQALHSLAPTAVIRNKAIASDVRYAELYVGDQHAMKSDVLYVLDESQLEKLSAELHANLLVIDAGVDTGVPSACNCILVPGSVNLPGLILLLGACSSALSRFDAYCGKLLSALVANANLDELLDIVAAAMGNPVVLMRMPGIAVAHSRQVETGDALWDRLVYEGSPIMEEEDLFDGYVPLDLFQGLAHPRYFVQQPWKRRIMMGVWVAGNCDHVLTILENDRTFDKSDELLSELMSQVLSSALQRTPDLRDSPGIVFGRLVSGELSPTEGTMRELSDLGFPSTSSWKMVLFETGGHEDTYLDQIRFLGRLREAAPNHLVFSHGDNTVAFVDADNDGQVESLLDQANDKDGWSMGVSMPFSSLRDLRTAYEQCKKCLASCSANHRRMVSYDGIMLEDFYRKAVDCGAWEGHVLPVAERIVAYDAENETEYAHTLWTYLKTFRDKNHTAGELFIHRNSVTYRLEKAAHLFEIDMDDVHALRMLELSFELLHALGRL